MGGRTLAKRKEREGGERNCSAARGAADEREGSKDQAVRRVSRLIELLR